MRGHFSFICFFLFLLLFANGSLRAQQTKVYTDKNVFYRDALDLFEKQKYAEAQEEFDKIVTNSTDKKDLVAIDAEYYASICAYELFNKDAELRLKQFLSDHPESPRCREVRFDLGKYNYRKKKFEEVLRWFREVDTYDLKPEELSEFYFKRGYAHYELGQIDSAKTDFYTIKDENSKYAPSADYYYSHIAYTQGNDETALQGFQKLSADETFGPVVPFYIAQIYFLQGKYQDVIAYAPPLLDSAKHAGEIAHLIGASYYRTGKFKEAAPYLLRYHNDARNYTRDDAYELAYAYYKTSDFEYAKQYFQEAIADSSDALAQNAWYYLADTYLKSNDKPSARNAFLKASSMKFDPVIREDALFSSAKLSYELDFSPFNEAIVSLNEYLYEFPNTPRHDEAYTLLTNVYLSSNHYKEALASISKIRNLPPTMQSTYQQIAYNLGIEDYRKPDFDGAIAAFDQSLTYPVNRELNSNVHYWKAETYYAKAQAKKDSSLFGKAISEYQQFQVTPGATVLRNYNTSNYNIGYCYFQQGNWNASMIAFRKYIQNKNSFDSDERIFDAYVRMGDGYFRLKDFANSADFYSKAVATQKPGDAFRDYAMFQQAMALGYEGKDNDKAAMLKKMRETYPHSEYFLQGRYQEARTLHDMRMYTEALAAYKEVYDLKPNGQYAIPCLKYMGLIYHTQNDNDNALAEYKKAIAQLGNSKGTDFAEIMREIKTIYIAKGQLDQWESYAASVGYTESVATADSTSYVVVLKHYHDGNCGDVLAQASKYIQKYPSGIYITDVHYMRAECSFRENDLATALESYLAILGKNSSNYLERCLTQSAYIYYKQDDFSNAQKMYERVENESSNPDQKNVARINLMRCWVKLGNNDSAAFYAQKVLSIPKVPNDVLGQAHFLIGKSALASMDYATAKKNFEDAEKLLPNTESAAESRYQLCWIKYSNKEYKTAEKALLKEINDYAGFSEWSGKGWLLLSDDYLALKDTFQAKNVLKIYIDNGDVPELIQQAKDKLATIESMQHHAERKKDEDIILGPGDNKNEDNGNGGGQ
ncbi:MAG: tetratricopeptide repeat protein [Bacteroidetes bacterium]|nr:tetratricopeptide repeat protein [Bacteroidota bacterium]